MFKTHNTSRHAYTHQGFSKISTSGAAEDLIVFLIGLVSVMLAAFLVTSTAFSLDLKTKAVGATTSFDTQLNEAQRSIRQYADDQVWLYSVTKQEGSFDTQLNEALSTIRKN